MDKNKDISVAIVVPYFGKLPSYFQLWLNSCEYNKNFKWFVFTNDNTNYNYPRNVTKIDMEFEDFVELIKMKFPNAKLMFPYKLCDYKVTYGMVLEEYLQGYDFWGHCDLDMIFGDLSKFITPKVLQDNVKIFKRGHLSLYKNEKRINELFLTENHDEGAITFNNVVETHQNLAFDESAGVYKIFEQLNLPVFLEEVILDITTVTWKFNTTKYMKHKNRNYQAFYYDQGKVYCTFLENGTLYKNEYAYIHFKRRKMPIKFDTKNKRYIISPYGFLTFDKLPSIESDFKRINGDNKILDYYVRAKDLYRRYKSYNLRKKINKIEN